MPRLEHLHLPRIGFEPELAHERHRRRPLIIALPRPARIRRNHVRNIADIGCIGHDTLPICSKAQQHPPRRHSSPRCRASIRSGSARGDGRLAPGGKRRVAGVVPPALCAFYHRREWRCLDPLQEIVRGAGT